MVYPWHMRKQLLIAFVFLTALSIFIYLCKTPYVEPPLILHFPSEKLKNFPQEKMFEAGKNLLYWQEKLDKTGATVITEVMGKNKAKNQVHYPKGDVYDKESLVGYFYHSHRKNEQGHFHLFFQEDKFETPPKTEGKPYTHIIAVSVDENGNPISLFTVNQWVTDETLRTAEEICTQIPSFQIMHTHPSYPLNQWLTNLVQLFRPQIEELIRARDERIAQFGPRSKRLEVVTETPISIREQIEKIKESSNELSF